MLESIIKFPYQEHCSTIVETIDGAVNLPVNLPAINSSYLSAGLFMILERMQHAIVTVHCHADKNNGTLLAYGTPE